MTDNVRECPSCGVEYAGDGHCLCFDCDLAYKKMEEQEEYKAEMWREYIKNTPL